jgi:hypothetical protein
MVFFWLCELPFLRISTESSGSGIPSFTALNLIVVFDSRSWSAIAIREGGQKAKLQGKWRREDLDVLRNDSRRFAIVEGKRINFHDFNVRLGKCLAKVTTAFVVPAPRNRIMEYIYIYISRILVVAIVPSFLWIVYLVENLSNICNAPSVSEVPIAVPDERWITLKRKGVGVERRVDRCYSYHLTVLNIQQWHQTHGPMRFRPNIRIQIEWYRNSCMHAIFCMA